MDRGLAATRYIERWRALTSGRRANERSTTHSHLCRYLQAKRHTKNNYHHYVCTSYTTTTTRRPTFQFPCPPRSKSPIQNKPNEVQRRLLEVETEYPHPISWKRAVPCRRSSSEVDWTSSRGVRASGPRPRKCKSVNAETMLQASFRLIRWSPQGKSPGQPMFRRGLEGDHSGDAGRLTRCANWTNGWEMMSVKDLESVCRIECSGVRGGWVCSTQLSCV